MVYYICSLISSSFQRVVFGIKKKVATATTVTTSSKSDTIDDDDDDDVDTSTSTKPTRTTTIFNQVQLLVTRLTGQDIDSITNDTELKNLGLDSLGATALLSLLKITFTASAKNLTMRELIEIETVGDLVKLLEGKELN